MMTCPQLWKLGIIVLQCEERFRHDVGGKAHKTAESTMFLRSGHWLWRSIGRCGLKPVIRISRACRMARLPCSEQGVVYR